MPRPALSLLALLAVAPGVFAADPPPPTREFRGVWVATVANIDWPSKPGLSADQQRAEFVALVDRFRKLNFNAVVLQVRPMADAFYPSKLEPWSEYLTGESGKDPGYDPLAFAISECHKRGMELHAWFNPYRCAGPTSKSDPHPTHVMKARPDQVKEYGKHHWMNPTHPDVKKHSLAVVADAVERYDLDGVHMDDYFYPYPEKDADGKEVPFPDDDTWKAYQQADGHLDRDDWRRQAVSQFVAEMYVQTKKQKPHVKVGISPFGIWKPGHPAGIAGFDQYAKLYADAKLWLNKGWVDYYTPQLYWPVKQEKQSYPKLLAWWASENTAKRHLWPGNYTGRAVPKDGWPASEVAEQIAITRGQKGAGGNVHFSARPLANSPKVTKVLGEVYPTPALVPASPWLNPTKPGKPGVAPAGKGTFTLVGDGSTHLFAAQSYANGAWRLDIVPVDPASHSATLTLPGECERLVVTPVSRTGVAGDAAER